jgi:hypothetical protein
MKFSRVVLDPKSNLPVIAFRDKEARNIYDMFRVRSDLHCRAYQHTAVQNTELMYALYLSTIYKMLKFIVVTVFVAY